MAGEPDLAKRVMAALRQLGAPLATHAVTESEARFVADRDKLEA
ncbi:MAG TPA: hypothetical protein VFG69_04165 [Nannocystaceae bacterium]|nr:hypothetical protein [Nannocystaceae bacterium]